MIQNGHCNQYRSVNAFANLTMQQIMSGTKYGCDHYGLLKEPDLVTPIYMITKIPPKLIHLLSLWLLMVFDLKFLTFYF